MLGRDVVDYYRVTFIGTSRMSTCTTTAAIVSPPHCLVSPPFPLGLHHTLTHLNENQAARVWGHYGRGWALPVAMEEKEDEEVMLAEVEEEDGDED